jgi:hypothetical protein
MTYATGETIIPSSSYSISHLSASCEGNEADCPAASAPLLVTTERWTNVDCSEGNNGIPNASDIGQLVDKVKDSRFIKPRVHVRAALLNPFQLVAAQDIARVVDAVKGGQYPFNIRCTTATPCTSDAECLAPATCGGNGFCTSVKDPCSGLCQP